MKQRFIAAIKLKCLTGFGWLPDIGKERRAHKNIMWEILLLFFDVIDLMSGNGKYCRWCSQVDLYCTIIMCFKRQLHIFFMICIRFIIVGIMNTEKLPKGKVGLFFLVFVKMGNKSREFKQLA